MYHAGAISVSKKSWSGLAGMIGTKPLYFSEGRVQDGYDSKSRTDKESIHFYQEMTQHSQG